MRLRTFAPLCLVVACGASRPPPVENSDFAIFTYAEPAPEAPEEPPQPERWVVGRVVHFEAVEACSGQPISLPASLPPAAGRQIELRVHSPRRLSLVTELWADDRPIQTSRIGAGWDDADLDELHAHCRVDASLGEERIVRQVRGTSVALTSSAGELAPTPAEELPPAPEMSSAPMHGGRLANERARRPEAISDDLLLSGGEVTVRVWSDRSLDLRSVVFELVEKHLEPDGGLEGWRRAWESYDRAVEGYEEQHRAWSARRDAAYAVWQRGHLEHPEWRGPGTQEAASPERRRAPTRARTPRTPAVRALQISRRDRALAACTTSECRTAAWEGYCWQARTEPECEPFRRRGSHRRRQPAPRSEEASARPSPQPATTPPPAPRLETAPPSPSPDARWDGYEYGWLEGGWRLPDEAEEDAVVVTMDADPPDARIESVPAAPSADSVWLQGYWRPGEGSYRWVAGRWVVPPRASFRWSPPRVELRAGLRVFISGAWLADR